MKDGLIKRGNVWAFVVDMGDQPCQRCSACRKRYWVESAPIASCPTCGGRLSSGKERRQRWHSGYPTRAAAKKGRDEARVRLGKGIYVAPNQMTVEQYLLTWLETQARQRKAGTVAAYRHKIQRYVLPGIGAVKLQKLSARHLDALYVEMLDGGGVGGKPLSISTVQTIHSIVRKALQDAYKRDEVAVNVATKATPPTRRSHGAEEPHAPALQCWTAEQVRRFVEALTPQRLRAAYILAVNTGMRRGEVLGLSWSDVDLNSRRLTVRQSLVTISGYTQLTTPKTGKPRQFQLDEISCAALRRWRAEQAGERLAWGSLWQDTGLVFTKEDGTRIQPESFTKVFRRIAADAGLPTIRFHDVRHTYATLALQAGVDIKVVSQRLGHANVGITWDTYAHVLPDQDEQAAELFQLHVYGAAT